MYQPKTGEKCSCKRGVERDNCPDCEGTDQRIDFKAIRARHNPEVFHLTKDGAVNFCGALVATSKSIHVTYAGRELDHGVWCEACRKAVQ